MGYACKYFKLEELVYPEVFHARGVRSWELLNVKLLHTLDDLRAKFGPLGVNTWHVGGDLVASGLRPWNTLTGAVWSMHKWGCAADLHPRDISPLEMQREILAHPDAFPHLTCMEDAQATVTWLHVDVRNHLQDSQIWVVQP